jgi:NitT/TauT family transport system permease protein
MGNLRDAWYRLPKGIRVGVVTAASIFIWEFICRVFHIKEFLVPAPSMVWAAFAQSPEIFLLASWYTFQEAVLGFFFAVVGGVVLAILIISSRFLEETLYVLLVTMNSVPKVAIAPLFVVWMGTGLAPKVAISATIAIFVIVVDVVLGLRSVDPEMLDLARSMKGTKLKTLIKIRMPHALPNLFAGMKVGITLSLIGAIVGEFVAADRGLGYLIMVAQGQFETSTMFAAVVILSIMGTVMFFFMDIAEKIFIPWHASRRSEKQIS